MKHVNLVMDRAMNTNSTPLFQGEPDYGVADIQANLRKLERRDLWVWGNAPSLSSA